jgi:hypothetical protein
MSGETSDFEGDKQNPNHGEKTDQDDEDMEMDASLRRGRVGQDDGLEEHCDPEDREADIWYKKEIAEARHKKEQEEKDAEIRYLKGQVARRQRREQEEREEERLARKDQGERAAAQYKQEQEAKDSEIQRLSGLLDGARSMVRVLSSFSDIKMDESKETYGSMPVLETVKELDEYHKEKMRASETTVPIANLTKIHETGTGKYHGKVVEPENKGTRVTYDDEHEAAKLEWYEKYLKREERETDRQADDSRRTQKEAPQGYGNYEQNTRSSGGGGIKMKPSSYDGLTPYEDYRVQFQMLSDLNKWSLENKALYLAGCLSKGARSVLNDLAPADRYDYDKLDEALRERYGTEDQAELFKAKLRSRTKGKEESLQELAHDIRRLVRLAYPGAAMRMHNDLTKDQFIEALGDGEIRWSVFQARPKNITEALKVAMELEAFKESEKSRLRKSVRGIKIDSNNGTLRSDSGIEESNEEGDVTDLELSLQQLVTQVKQLRQVSGNNGFRKKEYPTGNGKWPKEACGDNRNNRSGEIVGGANSSESGKSSEDRRYANGRTYDMSKIKCFRCDKVGHL